MDYYGVVSGKLRLSKDPIVELLAPLFPSTLNKIYNNRGITIFFLFHRFPSAAVLE